MSRKSGGRRKRAARRHDEAPSRRARPSHGTDDEDRRSVAVTVAWMLNTLATIIGLVLTAVVIGVGYWLGAATPRVVQLMPNVLLFTATATGILTLLLTVPVLRFRPHPPPRPITLGAVLIGLMPLIWQVILTF